MPLPHKEPLPETVCPNDYTALLRRYFPTATPTFGGLEGFINAKIMTEGLHRAGPGITRSTFITALETLDKYPVTKNLSLSFSHTNHQGLDTVYLSRITSGTYESIEHVSDEDSCIQE